jgi:hypothetical protein
VPGADQSKPPRHPSIHNRQQRSARSATWLRDRYAELCDDSFEAVTNTSHLIFERARTRGERQASACLGFEGRRYLRAASRPTPRPLRDNDPLRSWAARMRRVAGLQIRLAAVLARAVGPARPATRPDPRPVRRLAHRRLDPAPAPNALTRPVPAGLVASIACVALAIRAFRPSATIDDRRLTVRRWLRTDRLNLADVAEIALIDTWGWTDRRAQVSRDHP